MRPVVAIEAERESTRSKGNRNDEHKEEDISSFSVPVKPAWPGVADVAEWLQFRTATSRGTGRCRNGSKRFNHFVISDSAIV